MDTRSLIFYDSLIIIVGFLLIFFGCFLNKLAIFCNGGKMPVFCKTITMRKSLDNKYKTYCALKKTSRFKCLSDKYQINNRIVSLGDFIIIFGAALILLSIIFLLCFVLNSAI